MLTRLHVQGFKNLMDANVRFGPFTCIAGPNGAGKSNLFDAIRFLSLLTKHPIMEAAQLLRETKGRSPEPRSLFTAFGDYRAPEIRFTAEMIVDRSVQDDFGVAKTASISTLLYCVALRLISEGGVERFELVREELKPITVANARRNIGFPADEAFLASAITGVRAEGRSFPQATPGRKSPSTRKGTEGERSRRPSPLALSSAGRPPATFLRFLPRTGRWHPGRLSCSNLRRCGRRPSIRMNA